MTCDERRDLILMYVAGALEPAEADELRAHLATGCVRCAASLDEAERIIHALPAALPQEAAPPGAWRKLESRIERSIVAPLPERTRTLTRATTGWRSLGIAAAIGVAVFGLTQFLAEPAHAVSEYAFSDAATKSPIGKLTWDRTAGTWRVTLASVAEPPAGREYELWAITEGGEKIGLGMLKRTGGMGAMEAAVPQTKSAITLAAFTDEPAFLTAPTGAVRSVSSVK